MVPVVDHLIFVDLAPADSKIIAIIMVSDHPLCPQAQEQGQALLARQRQVLSFANLSGYAARVMHRDRSLQKRLRPSA